MGASILSRRDRMALENGMSLRLLSALEVLQARREADALVQESREKALCANACLLARALETPEHSPLFTSGQEVLTALRVEEIAALSRTWSQFNERENLPLSMDEAQVEEVKKN